MDTLRLLVKKLISGNTQQLSDLLLEGLPYTNDDSNLKLWITTELHGYYFKGLGIQYTMSSDYRHRHTRFDVSHRLGFNIRNVYDFIEDEMVLFHGVIEIEQSIKQNKPIVIINSKAGLFESNMKADWTDIAYKIKFHPNDLYTTLNKIRIEYINMLNDLIEKNEANQEKNEDKDAIASIKYLITNDEIEDALLLIAKEKPDLENDTIMFLSKLSNVRKQFINSTIKQDDYQLELNRIKSGVIGLLDIIKRTPD